MSRATVVALLMLMASPLSAQEATQAPFVSDVARKVLLDPTTYAPAVLAWAATRLDWGSSQVFFQNGFVEHNARFTISGRADDAAISYRAGNRQILLDAVANLQVSLLNNASERVIERLLQPRFVNHPKLLRTIGFIERSAVASFWTWRLSAGHVRQWQDNVHGVQ